MCKVRVFPPKTSLKNKSMKYSPCLKSGPVHVISHRWTCARSRAQAPVREVESLLHLAEMPRCKVSALSRGACSGQERARACWSETCMLCAAHREDTGEADALQKTWCFTARLDLCPPTGPSSDTLSQSRCMICLPLFPTVLSPTSIHYLLKYLCIMCPNIRIYCP